MKQQFFGKRNRPAPVVYIGIGTIIALLLVGAYIALGTRKNATPSTTTPIGTQTTPSESQTIQNGNDAKTSANPAQTNPVNTPTSSGTPGSTTGGNTNTSSTPASSLSLTILRANQSGATVSVRTIASGTTTGSCAYLFTAPSGATVTRTNSLTQDATSYGCNVDAPTTAINQNGTWTVKVSLSSGGASTSASQTFAVMQ